MLDEKEREEYIKQQSIDVFMDFLRRDGKSGSSKDCPELDSHNIGDKQFNLPKHLQMLAANFSEKLNQLSSIGKTSMVETKNGKKKRKRAALPQNIKMSR